MAHPLFVSGVSAEVLEVLVVSLLSFACDDLLCLSVVDVEAWGWSVDDEGDEEVGGAPSEVALACEPSVDGEELVVHVCSAGVVVFASSFWVVRCGISSEAREDVAIDVDG